MERLGTGRPGTWREMMPQIKTPDPFSLFRLHVPPALRTHTDGELPVCFDVKVGDRIQVADFYQTNHVSFSCSRTIKSAVAYPCSRARQDQQSVVASLLQSRRGIHHT